MSAKSLFLLRPRAFGLDAESARTNLFQPGVVERSEEELRRLAVREFDGLCAVLRHAGVAHEVLEEPADSAAVDAVFPNNWFSTHAGGELVLYPMAAPVRRLERRPELVERIAERCGSTRTVDLTHHEAQGRFLEGTGSLVLDRPGRVAFAARSERTDEGLVHDWARRLGYRPVLFETSFRGAPVYHTNVLMAVGADLAVWCPEVVAERDRERVGGELAGGGRTVLELSAEQLVAFCGNVFAVRCGDGATGWVMSTRARDAFRPDQRRALGRCLAADLTTIEDVGGGGARCMVAEAVPSRA